MKVRRIVPIHVTTMDHPVALSLESRYASLHVPFHAMKHLVQKAALMIAFIPTLTFAVQKVDNLYVMTSRESKSHLQCRLMWHHLH